MCYFNDIKHKHRRTGSRARSIRDFMASVSCEPDVLGQLIIYVLVLTKYWFHFPSFHGLPLSILPKSDTFLNIHSIWMQHLCDTASTIHSGVKCTQLHRKRLTQDWWRQNSKTEIHPSLCSTLLCKVVQWSWRSAAARNKTLHGPDIASCLTCHSHSPGTVARNKEAGLCNSF